MAVEVEQKFRVLDASTLRQRLAELGALPGETHEQVDCYYAHPQHDFARSDEALRLRRVGASNALTYKGPKLDAATKTRHEIEIELSPGSAAALAAAELLEALAFRPVAEVRKNRAHLALAWQEHEITVSLDQVEELGDFVELEIVVDPEQVAAATSAILSLAERLNLRNSERRSYLELLLEGRPKSVGNQ